MEDYDSENICYKIGWKLIKLLHIIENNKYNKMQFCAISGRER